MPRYTFKLEYDGSRFNGWPDVQAALSEALNKNNTPAKGLTAAEPTEAGVHASSQIVHFDLEHALDPFALKEDTGKILYGSALAIVAASAVPDDFKADAATERHYTYRLFSRSATLTYNKGTMWRIDHPLDVRAMREAAHYLIGRAALRHFCPPGCPPAGPLTELRIETSAHSGGTETRLHFRAPHFCTGQVRRIVALLERIGAGALPPEAMHDMLSSESFNAAAALAPPRGLYLDDIRYPESIMKTAHLPLEPITHLASGIGAAMLEQMPLPLLVITRKGRVAYANQFAFDLLPDMIIRQHFSGIFKAPKFVKAVEAAIDSGKTGRVRFSISDGPERFFVAHIGLLPAGSEFGKSIRVIAAIEERTTMLKSEQMRSDFIANVSHELRTPLATIIGYIETLQGHAKDDPEARARFLATMAKQAERMQHLVNDLMSLNRIEIEEHNRPTAPCALRPLVFEAIAAVQPLAERLGARIDETLPDSLPRVRGDHDQLAQVLVNLFENAMKYGGRDRPVRVFMASADAAHTGKIGISVQDFGAGLAPEHLGRLTERFYRVSVAKSRDQGGTGLGLAIVKHILNRHEGVLDIRSTEGRSTEGAGSIFTVWLPVFSEI
ncbi:MAG: ATP-binding protein [Rhodobacteraceae bacterium]|nr:ATP-binding protein [Paracoccaceae bacterium]